MTAHVVAGGIVAALSMICWGGRVVAWLVPEAGNAHELLEARDDLEPLYWSELRGEIAWDVATLWSMVAAGVLLAADHPWWTHFALTAGGAYVYFAGRGIFTRVAMINAGFLIGSPRSVRLALFMSAIWGAMATAMIIAAIVELRGR